MLHAVPLSVAMRFASCMVFPRFPGIILTTAATVMLGFQCGMLRNVPAQLFAQSPHVVGVYLRIVPPARDGDIRQPRIDKLVVGLFGVHVQDYPTFLLCLIQ